MILSFGLEVHLQVHLTQTLVPFKEGYDLKGKNDAKALLKLGRLLVVFFCFFEVVCLPNDLY